MTQYFNHEHHRSSRQAARAAMPRAEVLLWSKLKNRQLLGCKFRRQYGIESYRLDFYSPELMLGIELDGETHTWVSRPDTTVSASNSSSRWEFACCGF